MRTAIGRYALRTIAVFLPVVFAALFFLPDTRPSAATPVLKNSSAVSTAKAPPAEPAPAKPPAPKLSDVQQLLGGMRLVFSDEFTTFSRYVDAEGNVTCNSGGTGTWQTVFAFCSRTIFSNHEAEIYIDPGFLAYLKGESRASAETDSDAPVRVHNGVLAIQAKPATDQIKNAAGAWATYTSGLLTTQFSFAQTYGYFEVRAKVPKGKGLWPAFWLLPTDKSWPPEIDIFEAFGAPNTNGEGGRGLVHYASHARTDEQSCGNWASVGVDMTSGFHTYGADVEPTGTTYYFDGTKYATCKANPDLVHRPLYILLNLAVGGEGSWPGAPDSTTQFPATLLVDYVRAYHQK